MNCPTCSSLLSEVTIDNIQLDVCTEGCGGIWFDRFELQKMDEPHEYTDENLIELLSTTNISKSTESQRRNCPKCSDMVMMQHFYSVKRQVEVDHCPKCAGYWLDEGELFKIRNEYPTAAERKAATQKYFSELFDVELLSLKKLSDDEAEKVQKISNMFKLITPSYYLSNLKK